MSFFLTTYIRFATSMLKCPCNNPLCKWPGIQHLKVQAHCKSSTWRGKELCFGKGIRGSPGQRTLKDVNRGKARSHRLTTSSNSHDASGDFREHISCSHRKRLVCYGHDKRVPAGCRKQCPPTPCRSGPEGRFGRYWTSDVRLSANRI